MVMVKPALTYLDVVAAVRARRRRAGGRLPRERRVRHGQGGRRAGLDRRAGRRPRADHRHQAGRGRLRADLLRRRAGRGARWLSHAARRGTPRRGALRPGRAGSSPAGSTRRCGRSGPSAATPTSSPGARAPTCGTPTATGCSTSSSPTARRSSATPTPRWWRPCARRPARGTTFGAPTEGEVLLAEAIAEPGPRLRAGAPGVVGHRGHHERHPGGPRVHRPGPGRQVRRLLPRPLRRPAGRRGQRGGHPRAARLGRRAGRPRWPTPSSPPTTWCPSSTTGWPASSSRRWPPTWAWCPRPPASSRGCGRPATRSGALLVFDEVITGFRLGEGGAAGVHRGAARPVVLRQGDRRRPAGRRLRRAGGRPVGAGPARSRLPGRHPVGKPAGHRGRAAPCCGSSTSDVLRRPGRSGGPFGDSLQRGARPTRWPRPGPTDADGRPLTARVPVVGPLFGLFFVPEGEPDVPDYDGAAASAATGHLRTVLPRHAGPRRGPRARPLRGGVPVDGPRRPPSSTSRWPARPRPIAEALGR